MTDEESLLRAILANPAEDTPRLMYADEVQENGDADRAEFIRAQVRFGRAHNVRTARPARKAVREAFSGVVNQRRWGWLNELLDGPLQAAVCGECLDAYTGPGMRSMVVITRGFVSRVSMTAADFMQHAAALFARHPITEVVLTDREPDLYDLADDSSARVWHRQDPGVSLGLARSLLPGELIDLLPGKLPAEPSFWYDWVGRDEAHALAALSEACVRYGRALVGLPDLARDTTPNPTGA